MTVWYAQKSGNINAIEWDTNPAGGGTDLVWAALDPADILIANGKTVTINVDVVCAELQVGAAGGKFQVASGASNVKIGDPLADPPAPTNLTAGPNISFIFYHTSGTVSIYGSAAGGSAANAYGVQVMGAGGETVITVPSGGAITGGSADNAIGVYKHSGAGGSVTIYGPVTGGSAQRAAGAANGVATTAFSINGTVTGGSATSGIPAPGASGQAGLITIIGSLVDTETQAAVAGSINWQPVAGVHYHKVFYAAGAAKYYSPPPAQTDVRDGVFAGFSDGVAYNGDVVVPSAGDVRHGVDFDSHGKETGTLHLPAVTDVKTGVGYGTGGEEFTGTLAAGGGGVPLIGPGGLVG